jgi:nicotinamide mononucleotide adenylyltransferase
MRWSFTPREPWTAGNYQLMVSTALEDLAANKIGQLFDMDVFDKVTENVETRTIPVPFAIR